MQILKNMFPQLPKPHNLLYCDRKCLNSTMVLDVFCVQITFFWQGRLLMKIIHWPNFAKLTNIKQQQRTAATDPTVEFWSEDLCTTIENFLNWDSKIQEISIFALFIRCLIPLLLKVSLLRSKDLCGWLASPMTNPQRTLSQKKMETKWKRLRRLHDDPCPLLKENPKSI